MQIRLPWNTTYPAWQRHKNKNFHTELIGDVNWYNYFENSLALSSKTKMNIYYNQVYTLPIETLAYEHQEIQECSQLHCMQ